MIFMWIVFIGALTLIYCYIVLLFHCYIVDRYFIIELFNYYFELLN